MYRGPAGGAPHPLAVGDGERLPALPAGDDVARAVIAPAAGTGPDNECSTDFTVR